MFLLFAGSGRKNQKWPKINIQTQPKSPKPPTGPLLPESKHLVPIGSFQPSNCVIYISFDTLYFF
jgi:hypothetical protein